MFLDNITYHLEEANTKLAAAKSLLEHGFYSKALAKGKDIREIADYEVIAEITEEEAKSLIEDAEKFLERIKRAIQEMGEIGKPP